MFLTEETLETMSSLKPTAFLFPISGLSTVCSLRFFDDADIASSTVSNSNVSSSSNSMLK